MSLIIQGRVVLCSKLLSGAQWVGAFFNVLLLGSQGSDNIQSWHLPYIVYKVTISKQHFNGGEILRESGLKRCYTEQKVSRVAGAWPWLRERRGTLSHDHILTLGLVSRRENGLWIRWRLSSLISVCYYSSTALGKNDSIFQKASQGFAQLWQPGLTGRTLGQVPLVLDSAMSGNLARQRSGIEG